MVGPAAQIEDPGRVWVMAGCEVRSSIDSTMRRRPMNHQCRSSVRKYRVDPHAVAITFWDGLGARPCSTG